MDERSGLWKKHLKWDRLCLDPGRDLDQSLEDQDDQDLEVEDVAPSPDHQEGVAPPLEVEEERGGQGLRTGPREGVGQDQSLIKERNRDHDLILERDLNPRPENQDHDPKRVKKR